MHKIWQKLVTSWSFSKLNLNGISCDARIGNASLSPDFYGDVYGSALASFIGGVYCCFSSETAGRGASFMFVVCLNEWAWVSEEGREFGHHGFEIWYFAIKVLAKKMFVSYGFGVVQIAPPPQQNPFDALENYWPSGKSLFDGDVYEHGFFNIWPCWPQRHFGRPQLFYLNTAMVVKRRFSCIFMVVVKRISTVFLETVAKIWKTVSIFQNASKNTVHE